MKVTCGCKRHDVSIDDCLYYKDEWWTPHCFGMKIDKRVMLLTDKNLKMKDRYGKLLAKYILLKKYVRKIPCWHCGNKVGNRWGFIGVELVCGKCNSGINLGV